MVAKTTSRQRVAAYVRVSKERDGMQAPEMYRAQVREWCKRNRLPEPEWFEDIDFSGRKDSKPRPDYLRMLAMMTEFDLIVVPRLDRFGRSIKEAIPIFDRLEGAGVGFVALDVPGLDTTSSHGKFVRDLLVRLAELQSDQISDTWKQTHRHLRRNGRPVGGRNTPYGFRYPMDPVAKKGALGTYKVDAREAKVVRDIFDRFLAGESVRSITDGLNARRIRPNVHRGGTKWIRSTVANMLTNPAYAGLVEVDGDLVKASWPAIVPRKTWERAVQLREAERSRYKSTHPRDGSGGYLLSGLLVCRACGRKMHHKHSKDQKQRPTLYKCPNDCTGVGIAEHRAHALVSDAVLERLSEPYVERVLEAPKSLFAIEGAVDFDAALEDIGRRIDGLIEMKLEAGPDTLKRIQVKIDAAEDEAAAVRREKAETAAAEVGRSRRVDDLHKLRKLLADLPKVWDAVDDDARREVLRLCVERIETVPVPGQKGKAVAITWADWLRTAAA